MLYGMGITEVCALPLIKYIVFPKSYIFNQRPICSPFRIGKSDVIGMK